MNNGVENNQVAEPILTPIGDAESPVTTPVVNTMVPDTNIVVPSGAVESFTPAPVNDATISPPVVPAPVQAAPLVNPTIVAQEVQPSLDTTTTVSESVPDTDPAIVDSESNTEEKKNKKRKPTLSIILFIIILILGVAFYFVISYFIRNNRELEYKCSPIAETREEIHLDVNSTLVQDLYSKVATSIREDAAQPEWNDTMKIYLAYRQIPEYKKYDSNCNMFDKKKMEPYSCEESASFTPIAFKSNDLLLEWKKLYGEDTPMPYINIHLDNGCVGGFEYIKEREEYVQGYCKQGIANAYKVKKKVTDAVSSRNMIILTEDVQYSASEKMTLPSYLHSGTYYYTFRLDMNYNYVLVSKEYDQKY